MLQRRINTKCQVISKRESARLNVWGLLTAEKRFSTTNPAFYQGWVRSGPGWAGFCGPRLHFIHAAVASRFLSLLDSGSTADCLLLLLLFLLLFFVLTFGLRPSTDLQEKKRIIDVLYILQLKSWIVANH